MQAQRLAVVPANARSKGSRGDILETEQIASTELPCGALVAGRRARCGCRCCVRGLLYAMDSVWTGLLQRPLFVFFRLSMCECLAGSWRSSENTMVHTDHATLLEYATA